MIPSANNVPSHMRQSVIEYILYGYPLGDFLTALFSNNLLEACARADEQNLEAIQHWASFLFNVAPGACCGSAEKVKAWQEVRRVRHLHPDMVMWPESFKGDVRLLWDIHKTPAPSEA